MDDNSEEEVREQFQKNLDEFIENQTDMEGLTVGYVLVRVSQDVDGMGNGEAMYAYHIPERQPIHVTRGLLDMAKQSFDLVAQHNHD